MPGSARPAVAALALSLTLLSGCAPMRVNSFLERGATLSGYRTYAWAPTDRLSTGDPRLDNNPFFQRRLQTGVETELLTRGFQKADAGASDVVVHYHASVSQQVSVNGADQDDLRCETPPCSPDVYEKGSIVLDLVDRRTNKLVWRGWATTTFDNIIDNQRLFEQTIDEAVRKILDRLPPRGV